MLKKITVKLGIILLGINVFINVAGQGRYDYHTDTLTYSQYLSADWEALYDSVKVAEKEGIDFYYLQLRVAFAAFHTQRYARAEDYFNSAESLQAASDLINEYHYLSTLYAGHRLAMIERYAHLSVEAKNRYKNPKRKAVETLTVESGFNNNANFKDLQKTEIDNGYKVYGERVLLKNLSYNGLKMSHGILPWLTLNHEFQWLHLNKEQQIYATEYGTSSTINKSYPISTEQQQYHINGVINIKDKLFITPAFSYVNFKSEFVEVKYTDEGLYEFNDKSISDHQQLYALKLSYVSQNLEISSHSNYFWDQHFERWQMGLASRYYLKRDKSQYVSATFDMLNDKKNEWTNVWSLHYGFKLQKTWVELNHTAGDLHNFTESNGEIIYNTYENIESKTGANVSFPIGLDHLWLSFYYRYITYASVYSYIDDELVLKKENFNHNNHSITGGLTWYF